MSTQAMPGWQHPTAPRNALTIRKRLLVVAATLVLALALTSTVLAAASAGGEGAARKHMPLAQVQLQAELRISVNYAHEWVAGETDPSASVVVTLTDDLGATKADAVVSADGVGGFFVGCEDWSSGECPDIQPGDRVYVESAEQFADIDPIGTITGTLDAAENTVVGTLQAGWLPNPSDVQCEVWIDSGPEPITATADPGGGTFTCDFDTVGWDLGPLQTVAVMYVEPEGDTVINVLDWPRMQVNYAHDWVGGSYGLGHTVWITVTENDGSTVKGTATAGTVSGGGWGGDGFSTEPEQWAPEVPDIVPGDWVHFSIDDGFTRTIEVGHISGTLDLDADSVSGPIYATFPETLPVECHPWGAWNAGLNDVPVQESEATPDGTVPFSCSWDGEWDIVPAQDVAVLYVEPDGDMVIDVYRGPAPELGVWKWVTGGYARPGGVYVYGIQYRNDGTGPAEDAVIVDTLPPLTTYADDTAGLPVTVGPGGVITWALGTLDPGQGGFFMVTLDVDPGAAPGPAALEQNCVTVTTTSAGDWDSGNDSACADPVDVSEDDVELGIDKWPGPRDPTSGQEFEYTLQWCNNRGAAAGPVVLTDTLPDGTALLGWWPQDPNEPFWVELPSDPGELVLGAPGLPGDRCGEIYLRLLLNPGAEISTTLVNTVVIDVADDVDPGNNLRVRDDTHISPPRYDLGIHKDINAAVLVPGGYVGFSLDYQNNGNVATPVTLTDTVPTGLHYVSAQWADYVPAEVGPPPEPTITGDQVVWVLPELPVNHGHGLNVLFHIDEGIETGFEFGNCVEISGAGPEDNLEDNSDCFPFTVQPSGPNLGVHKWHEWHGEGQLGYRVRFDNFGDQPVGDVWITDTLPLGTHWDGWWNLGFDESRLLGFAGAPDALTWHLSEVQPGETGWLYFNADLDEPGEPARWYTNTVQIVGPPGDQNPDDNLHEDVAYSGGEVRRIEFSLDPAGPNTVWGDAHPNSVVTVTTPYTQIVTSTAPDRGWSIDPLGELYPGDVVTVTAYTGIVPVVVTIPEPLDAAVDTAADTVSGQIGGWEERPVEVHGNWPGGYQEVLSESDGSFLASYPDIPRGVNGNIRFSDQIGDAEIVFHYAFRALDLILTVDYDHDWVGAEYQAGHTIYLTVTDDVGAVKATAAVDTPPEGGWWSTNWDQWSPQQPDIVPGDWVYGLVDGGTYTTEVGVGTIGGQVDVDHDVVSGTLDIWWLTQPVLVSCEIHEEMGSAISFPDVNPKGGSFECDFSTAPEPWDILPGHNVAVNYTEPDGDRVQAHPPNPAPHLRVEKWSDSQPAEGGNMAFTVRYRNEGGMAAESVVLTDTLEGMTYLGDTSGLPVSGSDPVVWDVGTLEPSDWIQFTVYVQVTAPAPGPITNTLQIATSNPYDQGDPGEKVAQWAGEVVPNNTHLNVGKWAWTVGPAADTDVVFTVNVCNNGPTGSSVVTLTDVLTTSMALVDWWSQSPGWTEVHRDTGELTVALPSLPGHSCNEVYLRAHLAPGIESGSYLTNTATITATNDLEANDNQATWDGWVQPPRTNLYVEKRWAGGQLVQGGQLHYDVRIENTGNQPVGGAIVFTDTLPAYSTFDGLWIHEQDGPHEVTPTVTGPDDVVWEIPGLENGYSRRFELVLNVDGNAPPGAVLTNTVEISCLADENCEDNASTWVETLYEHGPNLRVRKSGSWDDWGENTRRASYSVSIENVGDEAVYDVAVTDAYPQAMQLDGGIDTEWWRLRDWGDDPAGHYLTATYEYLGAGESTWLSFSTIIPGEEPVARGLVLTNTVEVAGVPGEPTYDDNIDHAVLTTGPDLFVEKDWIGGQLLPGELITYSLVFGNDRPSHEWWWGVLGTPWLTDTIPDNTAFVTSTLRGCDEGMWCAFPPISSDGTHLTWQLSAPLNFGPSHWNEIHLTLRILETIEAYDVLINAVEIASDEPVSDAEPYLGNNDDEHVAVAVLPRFEVGKAYASSRVAGTPVTYTLSVTNTGNGVGTGVVLSDVLPAGLTYGGGDGILDDTAIRWEIPSIAAEGGVASGWFSATLGCALDPVVNDDYRVIGSDQGMDSAVGPAVTLDVVEPSISLALTHTVGHIVAGDTVYLTGTATTDGTPLGYTWDFGDGPVAGGLTASHVYAGDGGYTVVLTATDTCGYSDAVSAAIDVAAPDLVPSFAYHPVPAHVMVEWPVVFTDTTTTDGPALVAWHWDFGDGASGTGAAVSHAYLEAGTYTVTLTVTDALGYSAQHTETGLVTVSDCVPLSGVSLTYAPLAPLVNVSLVLTATIAPPDATGPVAYEWDFGDGSTETTAVPSVVHTYAASGPKEVRVTATNRCTPIGVYDQKSVIISPRRIYLPLVLRNY